MKTYSVFICALFLLFINISIFPQWVALDKNSFPNSKPTVRLISSDAASSVIKVELPGFILEQFDYEGKSYNTINIGEEAITTEPGLPEIPYLAKILAIPDNGIVTVEVIETGIKSTIKNVNIAPARESWQEGKPETPYIEDAKYYNSNDNFPGELVSVEDPVIFRDFRLARVSIFPIRYSASRKEIEAYSSVTVRINYLPGNGVNIKTTPQRKIAPSFAKIYKSFIFNYDEVVSNRYGIEDDATSDLMLCIIPDQFVNTFLTYQSWKSKTGTKIIVKKFSELGATANTPDVIKNYIAGVYTSWIEPPTHILLIGDAGVAPYKNYTSQYDGYTFANEDYFVEIEGNDYFPEMMIGRFTNSDDYGLQVMINKFLNYEKFPDRTNNSWYKKGIVCSNNQYESQVETKRYTAQVMRNYGGFTLVDTMMSKSNCLYSNSDVVNAINNGRSYLNYRGEGWSDGWWASCTPLKTSNINSLNNGTKLTFVTSIGCGVAMFNVSGTNNCFGEAWIELGTPTQPRGGVAFIGPTSNTHTTYNNKIDIGIYNGMFQEGMDSPGEVLLRGKLHMYGIFGNTTAVAHHFKIYCVLGDPSIHIWKDIPGPVTVIKPDSIFAGLNQIQMTVLDSVTSAPVNNARITLTGSSIFEVGYTDSLGNAMITCLPIVDGVLSVNVCGGNVIPTESTIEVVVGSENVSPNGAPHVTDIDGNNDGLVNPNEHCSISYILKNWGTIVSNNVTASLTLTDSLSKAQIETVDPVVFGNIAPEDSIAGEPFVLYVNPDCPIGSNIPLKLHVTSETNSWDYYFSITTHGCNLDYKGFVVDDEGSILKNFRMDPGETVNVSVKLLNTGDDIAPNIKAILSTNDQYITILDSTGTFGSLMKDSLSINETDYFILKVDENCPLQYNVNFNLSLWTEDGLYPYSTLKSITLPVAVPSSPDATGPDAYGYYAFSSKDVLWYQSPQFNWIEILGIGTEIPKPSNQNDFTQTVTLPFTFKYYGIDYNNLRISSDGWIAFGSGTQTAFENKILPFVDEINNMVAVFWDDLFTNAVSAEAKLLYYYDDANHKFIVEWNKVPHFDASDELETFQVVLLDPLFHPTTTGDGEIILQYKDVEEPSSITVGIENSTEDTGLLYLFNEMYNVTANDLENEFAIKITTNVPTLTSIDEDLNPDGKLPLAYSLEQNFPNPFNPETRIRYSIVDPGFVTIKIYSINGEMIKELESTQRNAGTYEVNWNGKDKNGNTVSSGVYFYQLITEKFSQTKKLMLIK